MSKTVKELLVRYTGDTKGLQSANNKAKKTVGSFSTSAKASIAGVTTSLRSLSATFAPLLAILGAREVIGYADQYKQLSARIKNATETQADYEESLQRIRNTAVTTGADMGSVVDVFQRISIVKEEINATNDELLTFSDTVSKLGVLSGASTGALNAGLTQLGQGLGAGVLRAEEFNSIVENIPSVAQAIAEEFGVSTGELRKLVIAGEVLSEDVFNAVLNKAEETRAEFEKYPETIGKAFNQLKIRLMETVGGLDSATGSSQVLITTIVKLGDIVSAIGNQIISFTKLFSGLFKATVANIIVIGNTALKIIEKTINALIGGFNKISPKDIDKVSLSLDVTAKEIFKASGAMDDFKDSYDSFKKSGENVVNLFGVQTQAQKVLSQGTKDLTKDYAKLADKIKDSDDKKEKSKKKTDELKKSTEELGRTFSSAFEDAVIEGKKLSEVISGLAKDIQRIILRKTVSEPIGDFVTGALGSVFGGSNDEKGSSSNALSGVLSSVGSFAKGLVGFDSGGSFSIAGNSGIDRNTLSLNGQPIANVSKGESVAVGRSGMGNGTTVNQTINVSTGVEQTVRAELARFAPQLVAMSEQGVQNAQSRNRINI